MRWCVGIEDTAIGVPIRHSGRTLDEYELTEHAGRFREDLDLAASLGIDAIRYGFPWFRVNPAARTYRWDLVDPAIEHALRLGVDLIVDLVHYGVPGWLAEAFVDPGYPNAIEDYAGAFATRYGRDVLGYTPLNEPLVTAAYCGETGGWPPYLVGTRGWTAVTVAIARGIQLATRAIRSAAPGALIVHVDAAKILRPGSPELEDVAQLERDRAMLPTDLILGRVGDAHPMWQWSLDQGADAAVLSLIRSQAIDVDVVGTNYYPQYSVRELRLVGGRTVEVAGGGTGQDLAQLLTDLSARYRRPVGVTETSFDGDDDSRVRWLRESAAATRAASRAGADVWCYTWWPLFDFVDWGIAAGGRPLEDFLVQEPGQDGAGGALKSNALLSVDPSTSPDVTPWLKRMGLWRLEASPTGLERIETQAARAFRDAVAERVTSETVSPSG